MNNLMQRRRQMQNMPQAAAQDNSFNDWYNVGSAIGGATFGNMAKATNDGEYNGVKLDKGDSKLSDKEWVKQNQPEAGSYGDRLMNNIAQSGDNFVNVNADGDKDWDAIGAFANGYQQTSRPDIVGLEQGMQLGKQALGSGYSFNRLGNNIGYDPNWRLKAGRLF